ncbi:MAG TPA: hypothetical protein PKM48_03475 [Parvularculaceae bacterium]|nr:hypothetical protein [Parvularculaceae bacterium]
MAYLKLASFIALAALAVACKDGAGGDGAAAACPATNPREPHAWIDKMPGMNDNPTLHVTLKFDTPNAGDDYTLVFSGSEESAPPAYIYDLERVTVGNATVVTEYDLHYREPDFAEPSLRAVKINCGGKLFQEISPVEETD